MGLRTAGVPLAALRDRTLPRWLGGPPESACSHGHCIGSAHADPVRLRLREAAADMALLTLDAYQAAGLTSGRFV